MTTAKHPRTVAAPGPAQLDPAPVVSVEGVPVTAPLSPEVEQVDGYHLIHVDGIPRYVSDHDGYQTAYAHEARAHNAANGR